MKGFWSFQGKHIRPEEGKYCLNVLTSNNASLIDFSILEIERITWGGHLFFRYNFDKDSWWRWQCECSEFFIQLFSMLLKLKISYFIHFIHILRIFHLGSLRISFYVKYFTHFHPQTNRNIPYSNYAKPQDFFISTPCFIFQATSVLKSFNIRQANYNLLITDNQANFFNAFARLLAHPLQRSIIV